MTDGTPYNRISDNELLEDYYDNLHAAYNSMREAFQMRATQGLTKNKMALALGVDKILISRRLNVSENLTLKTLSYMGSAMKCKAILQYVPYEFDGLYDELQYGKNTNPSLDSIGPKQYKNENANRSDMLGKVDA
jgi:hypothetical protein